MKYLSFLIFFLLVKSSFAQDYPITDRSFGYATAFTMPKNTAMLETGFFQVNGLGGSSARILGQSLLFRYGLAKSTEIRFRTGYQSLQEKDFSLNGIAPVELSLKQKLMAEGQYLPAVYFLAEATFPIGKEGLTPEGLNPSARIILEKYLNHIFIIGANLGGTWYDDNQSSFNYSISLRTALCDEISFYTEFFGKDYNYDYKNNFFGVALEFWLFPELVFDIAAGVGVSAQADNDYFAAGLAYRFD